MSAWAVQLLITLGAVLPVVLGGLFARRRATADAEVTLSTAAREWATDFAQVARDAVAEARSASERCSLAETRVLECHRRVDAMEHHIEALESAMRAHQITPPPRPWVRGRG